MLCSSRAAPDGAVPRSCCCAAAFYDHVYVGTEDGRVALVKLDDGAATPATPCEHRIAGGRPVTQLVAMGEIGLLFALSGGSVEAVDAQRLTPRPEARISLKAEVLQLAVNQDEAPDFALCLATSHKLHLFRWAGDKHEPWKTLNISSPPLDLAWSRHSICAALEDQVTLVDILSNAARRVHSLAGASAMPARRGRGGGRRSSVASAAEAAASAAGPREAAKVCALPGNRFLMVLDSLGIVIRASGEPAGNTVVWDTAPLDVACSAGLVLSLHSAGDVFEVRRLAEGELESTALLDSHHLELTAAAILAPAPWHAPAPPTPTIEDLTAGGGVLLLSHAPPQFLRLGTISLRRRIEQLFEQQDIDAAFALFKERALAGADSGGDGPPADAGLFAPEPSASREEAISRFYAQAGLSMLGLGRVKLAFEQFSRANLDPRELLASYESVRPPQLQWAPVVLKPPSAPPADGDHVFMRCALLMAMPESRRTLETAEQLHRELAALLWAARSGAWPDAALEAADEALLTVHQTFGLPDRDKLEALCEGPNRLAVEMDAVRLRAAGRLHAAALLLASAPGPSRREALQLWADMGSGKLAEEGRDGLQATVRFLAAHHRDEPDLVWAFSSWVLAKSPRDGVRIFCSDADADARAAVLTPERVLAHLQQHDPDRRNQLCLVYLMHLARGAARAHDLALATEFVAVMERGADALEAVRPDFSAFVARDETLRGSRTAGAADGGGDGGSGTIHTETFEAELVARRIDQSPLEATLRLDKVPLFRKCGWHRQALEILVEDDPDQAEAYCLQADSEPFLDLLCIYFRPENAARFRAASLAVLERHGHRIDASQVVAKLPADLPVRDLQMYLSLVLRRSTSSLCSLRVERNLNVAHNIKVRDRLMRRQRQNVTITSDTRCGRCNRPMGAAALALDPAQAGVVHLACAPDAAP